MSIKDIFSKENISKCFPVSGYLIFIFFIYYSSFLNITLTESIDEELLIYIISFIYYVYTSLV